EVTGMQMWDIFTDEYLPNPQTPWGRFALVKHELVSEVDGDTVVKATILDNGEAVELTGHGNGPIAAFCEALHDHADVRVLDYHEHALASGGDAKAAAYLECAVDGKVLWGVGIHSSIVTASLKAVVSAMNRAHRG
nr:alpha-isopropylmalate synthase regulatory domain-containing protein [Actinomycetota bacterium]